MDIGRAYGSKYFINIAAAGTLTELIYSVPSEVKTRLGYFTYGAKRIERTIRELFEVVSDAKMKEVGQILFDMSEIKEQLLVETGLDIEPVIVEEVNKHLTRVKEFKKNE